MNAHLLGQRVGRTVVTAMLAAGAMLPVAGAQECEPAIIASIGRLKAIAESFPLALQINCTVQRGNADHLQEVADFAEAQGVPVAFTAVIRAEKSEAEYAARLEALNESVDAA